MSPLSSVAIRYSMHKNGARYFPDCFSTSFFNCGMYYNINQISEHACNYMNLWNMKQNDGIIQRDILSRIVVCHHETDYICYRPTAGCFSCSFTTQQCSNKQSIATVGHVLYHPLQVQLHVLYRFVIPLIFNSSYCMSEIGKETYSGSAYTIPSLFGVEAVTDNVSNDGIYS